MHGELLGAQQQHLHQRACVAKVGPLDHALHDAGAKLVLRSLHDIALQELVNNKLENTITGGLNKLLDDMVRMRATETVPNMSLQLHSHGPPSLGRVSEHALHVTAALSILRALPYAALQATIPLGLGSWLLQSRGVRHGAGGGRYLAPIPRGAQRRRLTVQLPPRLFEVRTTQELGNTADRLVAMLRASKEDQEPRLTQHGTGKLHLFLVARALFKSCVHNSTAAEVEAQGADVRPQHAEELAALLGKPPLQQVLHDEAAMGVL
mmetsp:Transcript_76043/g.195902  ORF Transcript_76043/g.195902 Transcript_76043/m.195902 type:complete len:265 (-) Transcript_76043:929-1723(-)